MKFRIVRFIVGIVGLIVIIQVLTAIYFSSKHWPEDDPVIGKHYVGRSVGKARSHVEKEQVGVLRLVRSDSVNEFSDIPVDRVA